MVREVIMYPLLYRKKVGFRSTVYFVPFARRLSETVATKSSPASTSKEAERAE